MTNETKNKKNRFLKLKKVCFKISQDGFKKIEKMVVEQINLTNNIQ